MTYNRTYTRRKLRISGVLAIDELPHPGYSTEALSAKAKHEDLRHHGHEASWTDHSQEPGHYASRCMCGFVITYHAPPEIEQAIDEQAAIASIMQAAKRLRSEAVG